MDRLLSELRTQRPLLISDEQYHRELMRAEEQNEMHRIALLNTLRAREQERRRRNVELFVEFADTLPASSRRVFVYDPMPDPVVQQDNVTFIAVPPEIQGLKRAVNQYHLYRNASDIGAPHPERFLRPLDDIVNDSLYVERPRARSRLSFFE